MLIPWIAPEDVRVEDGYDNEQQASAFEQELHALRAKLSEQHHRGTPFAVTPVVLSVLVIEAARRRITTCSGIEFPGESPVRATTEL